MIGHNSSVFRFSGVEVHEQELHIRRNGDVLPVEPKAFRILLHLVRNPGRLIPKDELIHAAWGETSVTDNSLTRNIALLRRLLGDDPRDPHYIETVSTVGYRFVSPVEVEEGSAGLVVESPGTTIGKTQEAGRRRTIGIWLPLYAALLIVAAASAWYVLRPLPPARLVSVRQITYDGADKALVGTDGPRIYFTRNDKRRSVFYVLAAGGDITEIPIRMPHDVWVADVSPDGAYLLVATDENGMSPVRPLWIVRATDGVPVRHLPDAATAAFSADAKSVIYCPEEGIWRVGTDGMGAVKIASPGEPAGPCTSPEWSPDGTLIRFNRFARMWEVSSNGSNLHRVIPEGTEPRFQGDGRWTADGSFYVFPGWLTGWPAAFRGDIWALDERRGWLRRPPRGPVRLTAAPTDWGKTIYPAREGNIVFATGEIPRGELSRFDGKTNQFQPFLGGISVQGVTFSRDGRSVAYVSYPEAYLFKANRDGSNPVQITDEKFAVYEPAWSPDGTQIAFMDWPAAHVEVYLVSADGGVPHRLLPDDPDEEWNATWSPDGKEIAFCVFPPGQISKAHIRIANIATRQIRDLPGSMTMNSPLWSPDGRFIAAMTDNFFNIKLFDIQTQRWIPLVEKAYTGFPTWSSDSRWLYYWSRDSTGNTGIFRVRIPGGKRELVVSLKGIHTGGWWNDWMGLDATDTPLIMRNIGRNEIYALALDRR